MGVCGTNQGPIKGIGINGHPSVLEGCLSRLHDSLELFQSIGFDHVELPAHGLDVIVGGKINNDRLERIRRILAEFSLSYTVHAPNYLNLMDLHDEETHRRVFTSCLEFTGAIGGELLVYHAGTMPGGCVEDESAVERLKARERDLLKEFSDLASDRGVLIAVENSNIEPEVARGRVYAYGARVEELVEQIIQIHRSNVGITLDLGHAYVASRHYSFDYHAAVQLAAPYVKNLHVYDSFGRVNQVEVPLPYMYQVMYGLDDLHLPIGWGDMPLERVFSGLVLPPTRMTLELKPRYADELITSLSAAKRLATLVRESTGHQEGF